MSKAYICDKCGRMQPEKMDAIWTVNPLLLTDESKFELNLCAECYESFKREYMENLIEDGERE